MSIVAAWTIIGCTLLVCLTAITISGQIAGRKIAPKEEFRVSDIPMPTDERPMPMPARMKNRKLD